MDSINAGRPPVVHYAAHERVQLNVEVPLSFKRALVERAAGDRLRLGDEVRAALSAWLGLEDELEPERTT